MAQISLLFHACVIGVEGFATDDEGDYFEGEVEFDLAVDGEVHRGLVETVKQAQDPGSPILSRCARRIDTQGPSITRGSATASSGTFETR